MPAYTTYKIISVKTWLDKFQNLRRYWNSEKLNTGISEQNKSFSFRHVFLLFFTLY